MSEFITIQSLAFDGSKVTIHWHANWHENDEVPEYISSSRILKKTRNKMLVKWQPTVITPEKAIEKYQKYMTPEQVRTIAKYSTSPKTTSLSLPWHSTDKIAINQYICNIASTFQEGLCVYLDAEDCQTTNTFSGHVQIPMIAVNFDAKVIQSMMKLNKSLLKKPLYFHGSFYDCLDSLQESSISCIFADYCYSFYNKRHDPKKDIGLMKTKLRPSSFVAFTFSLRAGKRRRWQAQVRKIQNHIQAVLEMTCCYKLQYKQMIFLAFHTKDN